MSPDAEQAREGDRDQDVIESVLDGDVEAFAVLVDRYQRQVVALGYRFFSSREDAEDFAQDVFLQAYRKLSTFSGSGRFYSWLMRIAYNFGYRKRRRAVEFATLPDDPVDLSAQTPAETAMRREAQLAVVEAIQKLPVRYSTCVGLYYFFGLTYEEIEMTTGYPINTVRSHMRRARIALAGILREHILEESDTGGGET